MFHNGGGSTMGEVFDEPNDQHMKNMEISIDVRYTSLLDALRKTEHTTGHIQSPFQKAVCLDSDLRDV